MHSNTIRKIADDRGVPPHLPDERELKFLKLSLEEMADDRDIPDPVRSWCRETLIEAKRIRGD